MTFAVSNTHGLIYHELQQGSMTSELFNAFLLKTIDQLPGDGQPRTFIFDNASSHKGTNRVNLSANFEVRLLPPYSPFLNIVENCFSQWKAVVKRDLGEIREQQLLLSHQERMTNLAQIAEQNVNIITVQNAISYFRRLQGYLPRCIARDDISM